jgi:hypothetical protein
MVASLKILEEIALYPGADHFSLRSSLPGQRRHQEAITKNGPPATGCPQGCCGRVLAPAAPALVNRSTIKQASMCCEDARLGHSCRWGSLAGAPPGHRRNPRLLGKSKEPPSVFIAPSDRIVLMAFLVIARFVPRDCQVVPAAVTNAAVGRIT